MVEKFQSSINRLKDILRKTELYKVDITKSVNLNDNIFNFKERRLASYKDLVESCLRDMEKDMNDLNKLIIYGPENGTIIFKIHSLVGKIEEDYRAGKVELMKKDIDKVVLNLSRLSMPEVKKRFNFKLKLPLEIREEVKADIDELEKCFENECYRSVIVLCGRILEVILHRKYFEITGIDILDKDPGIGLGKLIAKLNEKNVEFDPGLTQQIHLINQVRVLSVHKKNKTFYPSRAQTEAIILYTLDAIEKLS